MCWSVLGSNSGRGKIFFSNTSTMTGAHQTPVVNFVKRPKLAVKHSHLVPS